MATRTEVIKCPVCLFIQPAEVEVAPLRELGVPWDSFVHECTQCGYVILESEWERVGPLPESCGAEPYPPSCSGPCSPGPGAAP